MEFKYGDILLRDPKESDIDDEIRWNTVETGQQVFYALGVEINEPAYWNHGIGTQALAAYIRYQLEHGHRELCLQTWSGNIRMIKCAEKLGFSLCARKVGLRQVRGGTYDGLTFRLDLDKFLADGK